MKNIHIAPLKVHPRLIRWGSLKRGLKIHDGVPIRNVWDLFAPLKCFGIGTGIGFDGLLLIEFRTKSVLFCGNRRIEGGCLRRGNRKRQAHAPLIFMFGFWFWAFTGVWAGDWLLILGKVVFWGCLLIGLARLVDNGQGMITHTNDCFWAY